MRIRELVRLARRSRGLTQREVARLAGVPQSTVARIELGTIEPRADTLERIVAALGHEIALEPRLGEGVDRSLIRSFLQLSPKERIAYGASAGRAFEKLRMARERAE